MSMTEDGQFLLTSHQAAGMVSIYDVRKEEFVGSIQTPSPRSILCRGDQILVANSREGTISIFSRSDSWRLVKRVEVEHPNIMHLSAAQGPHYKGELIVTCHEDGVQGSYLGPHVFHLDVERDRDREIAKESLVSVSYDGRIALSQTSFRLSPSGTIAGYAYRDLVGSQKAEPFFRAAAEGSQTPYIYQVHSGSYWLASNMVFGGAPLKMLKEIEDKVLIPDLAQRVVYILSANQLSAHRLDVRLSEIDNRRVLLPADLNGEFHRLNKHVLRRREYLLDHCLSFTHDDTLHLFILDHESGTVLKAKTASFATPPPQPAPRSTAANSAERTSRTKSTDSPNSPQPTAPDSPSANDWADAGPLAELPLEPDHYHLTPGRDGQSLLLLQGNRLRRLGADGLSVTEEWTLADRYRWIAERADNWIALRENPYRLDIIDKRRTRVTDQISIAPAGIQVMDVHDLVIHPRERITYIAIKHDIQLPRYRVLIVNETTGGMAAPDHLLGKYLAIDPAGRYLYAAYSDIYERGATFHISPDWQITITPKYGNIDWLLSYNLSGRSATFRQAIEEAGGNSRGLRISPDGERLTYLSVVGSPPHSKNLVGFDPTKLDSAAVLYETGDVGDPTMVAFHPKLNLVASPGDGAAVLFNRETGEQLDDRLALPAGGLRGADIEDLRFSPDGKALIFAVGGVEGRRLIKVDLRLSKEDEGALTPSRRTGVDSVASRTSTVTVQRSHLDSLQPPTPPAAPATPKQIARHFMQSVVRVRCGNSSATGFVVGKRGYILTSAHALPGDADIVVTYDLPDGKEKKTITARAELAAIDEPRDLALLKIEPAAALRPVMIALNTQPEAGEQVTVIGHPAVGSQVLMHTLTTGVVSSANQVLEGRSYVQTSAAVNPGNSGGPMFDPYGRVVGLIAIKANIEGAGFAVPAAALRSFLNENSTTHPKTP